LCSAAGSMTTGLVTYCGALALIADLPPVEVPI
jgi:hypothetical protein